MRQLETLYDEGRRQLVDLLTHAGPEVGATAVGACPKWTVKDVVAHLTGVCADVLDGRLDGVATDGWTAAQVDARRGRSLDEVLGEWADVGSKIAAIVDDFPGWSGPQLVTDLTTHEVDVFTALGRAPQVSPQRLRVCLDFLVGTVMDEGARGFGRGPLEVRAGGERWVVGAGEHPVASLDAPAFELFRALTGRRSSAQIGRFGWSEEPTPYLPLFGLGPFSVRETELVE